MPMLWLSVSNLNGRSLYSLCERDMNDYQKNMLKGLARILEEMSDAEFKRRFDESKITEEEASQYAILEKIIMDKDNCNE